MITSVSEENSWTVYAKRGPCDVRGSWRSPEIRRLELKRVRTVAEETSVRHPKKPSTAAPREQGEGGWRCGRVQSLPAGHWGIGSKTHPSCGKGDRKGRITTFRGRKIKVPLCFFSYRARVQTLGKTS